MTQVRKEGSLLVADGVIQKCKNIIMGIRKITCLLIVSILRQKL